MLLLTNPISVFDGNRRYLYAIPALRRRFCRPTCIRSTIWCARDLHELLTSTAGNNSLQALLRNGEAY